FPELKNDPANVAAAIRDEEETFERTLDRGLSLFRQACETAKRRRQPEQRPSNQQERPIISGEDAFELQSTYGFPIDLTQLLAPEASVDVDLEGFKQARARHVDVSRGEAGVDARQSLVGVVQMETLPKTRFLGHDQLVLEQARIAKLFVQSG